jgi:predicted lipoprotein
LFDDAGEQSVALGKLSDADGPSRRCRYAEAVAEDVVNSIDKLHEAWVSEEDGFAAALAASGQAGGAYSSQALALNDVVNKLIFAVETMESKKLSKPLGRQDDNPKPILVESRFSNNAVADLIDNYEGVRSVYFAEAGGDAGFGLDDAVRSLSPEIDQSIQEQLLLVKADLDSLPIPLDEAVVTNRQDVERAFQSTKQLLRLFGADMSGVLGTTPTFSDNDGD